MLILAAGSGERDCSLPMISNYLVSVLKINEIKFLKNQYNNYIMITINQHLSKEDCEKLTCALHEAVNKNKKFNILSEKKPIDWIGKFENYPYKNTEDINVSMRYQASIGSHFNINNEYWIQIHGSINISGDVYKERYVEYGNFNYEGLNAKYYILIYNKDFQSKYLKD